MSRVIVECPMCGTWEGPEDGDASRVIFELCEACAELSANQEELREADESKESDRAA